MSSVILTPEEFCREFVDKVPTPNVHKAIKFAEEGLVTWEQVASLFTKSLKSAMIVVQVSE